MASVNPMTAVAAYRSAAMSIVHQQGVTSQAQAQMRVPPMLESVGGASPPPHGINGSITPSGPQYPFVAGKAPELSFAALVKSGVQNTIDANRHAEYISMEGVAGRADVTEVVAAISNAEASLNTLIAVRDKVITAYQEIMRMPI